MSPTMPCGIIPLSRHCCRTSRHACHGSLARGYNIQLLGTLVTLAVCAPQSLDMHALNASFERAALNPPNTVGGPTAHHANMRARGNPLLHAC